MNKRIFLSLLLASVVPGCRTAPKSKEINPIKFILTPDGKYAMLPNANKKVTLQATTNVSNNGTRIAMKMADLQKVTNAERAKKGLPPANLPTIDNREMVILPVNGETVIIANDTPMLVFDPVTNEVTETNGRVILGNNTQTPKISPPKKTDYSKLLFYYLSVLAVAFVGWMTYKRFKLLDGSKPKVAPKTHPLGSVANLQAARAQSSVPLGTQTGEAAQGSVPIPPKP